jgi:predicted RNase H-related nuclease YkuK (DUF458 family)
MNFRKIQSKEEFDLVEYLNDYLLTYPNVEVLVGCDSQNHANKTVYALVVALYHTGKGAHVIFNRFSTELERVRSVRLLSEVWKAIEVAEIIRKETYADVKYIDIDLNPDPRYKSNEVFRQAVGMVEGMGYEVRYKTLGPIATYAADNLVRV